MFDFNIVFYVVRVHKEGQTIESGQLKSKAEAEQVKKEFESFYNCEAFIYTYEY